jgi:hypothetical protein
MVHLNNPVRVVKEDVLSGISTKNDVIRRAEIMNACFAWHKNIVNFQTYNPSDLTPVL